VLDLQQGPTLLVGHSYGGVVITQAGNAPNVAGLVYIAAFIPDKGESALGLLSQKPLANNDTRATKDDFLYMDPAAFPADLPLATITSTPISSAPWRSGPVANQSMFPPATRFTFPDQMRWRV